MDQSVKLDPIVLGSSVPNPFFRGVSPNRTLMYTEHLKLREREMAAGHEQLGHLPFKATDQHGARGVVVEIKDPKRIPNFRLSDIPGAPKSV
jgi:hypothetical protein